MMHEIKKGKCGVCGQQVCLDCVQACPQCGSGHFNETIPPGPDEQVVFRTEVQIEDGAKIPNDPKYPVTLRQMDPDKYKDVPE